MAKSAYIEKLASTDPAAAKAWAARDPELRAAVAESLAAASPRDALAWLSGFKNDRQTSEARGRVMGRWAATDLTAAFGALDADGSTRTLAAASPALKKALSTLPPERVLAAFAQYPDLALTFTGANTGSPAGSFLKDFAERDPAGSAKTLLGMEPSTIKDEMLAKWAVYWPGIQQSQGDAIREDVGRLVAAEPPGPGRDSGVHALITASALAGDTDMAFQWLARQSAARRASSLDQMVRTLAEHDPAALAARWKELPVAEQASQREVFVNTWRKQNAAAADAWAASNGK